MTSILKRIYKSTIGIYERKDLTSWNTTSTSTVPIYGIYHIFCDANWEEMVCEQMKHLCQSGLFDVSKKLYISCIARNDEDVKKLKQILVSFTSNHAEKIEFVALTTTPTHFEFPALDYMFEKSQKEDFYFYYFHTKGITYQSLSNTNDKEYLGFVGKIIAWRRMMEYFLMDKWQVAVNVLKAGYDTYGCYLFPPFKNKMYAGNFWWTKSAYFRSLNVLDEETKLHNRFMAEEWLLSKPDAKSFSAFDTVADLYFVEIPPSLYQDGKHSIYDALKFCIIYTFRKYQRKWFGYSYKKHCQERFQQLKQSL